MKNVLIAGCLLFSSLSLAGEIAFDEGGTLQCDDQRIIAIQSQIDKVKENWKVMKSTRTAVKMYRSGKVVVSISNNGIFYGNIIEVQPNSGCILFSK